MNLRIRHALERDATLLSDLAQKTYIDTFGATNRAGDIEMYASHTYSPAIQLGELRDERKLYLIAEVDDVAAGFAMLGSSESPSCAALEKPIELFRFYVDHAWHGKGIAQALMKACEDETRALGGATLWLGVWENNPRAIRFYEKIGFRDIGSQPYLLGEDMQTDRVMVRSLR